MWCIVDSSLYVRGRTASNNIAAVAIYRAVCRISYSVATGKACTLTKSYKCSRAFQRAGSRSDGPIVRAFRLLCPYHPRIDRPTKPSPSHLLPLRNSRREPFAHAHMFTHCIVYRSGSWVYNAVPV